MESIDQLLALQDIDKLLFDLERNNDLPTKIKQHEDALRTAQAKTANLGDAIKQLQSDQGEHQQKLRRDQRRLQECEGRFAAVTTSKEYDALQLEVARLRSAIATQESRILTLAQQIEKAQESVRRATNEQLEVQAHCDKFITLMRSELTVIEAQRAELSNRREVIAHSVDPNMLAIYNRARGRDGIRIAASRRNACGCCFHQLPPQNLSEVRNATHPTTCDHCACLVVWDAYSGQDP